MKDSIIERAVKELETKITKKKGEIEKKKEEKALFYEKNFPKINPGIVTKGIVVGKNKEGILVSIGLKEEGIISLDELSLKPFKNPDEVVKTGDKIEVIVLSCNNGNFVLSKKRADLKNSLDKIDRAFNNNATLEGIVSSQVKGGLLVDLGISGFIPVSHIKKEAIRNLDLYVGKEVRFKVIEFDRKKKEVILSLRKVQEDEEKEKRERLFNTLLEGEIIKGKIIKLTEFGAFVDIGGIDGLIPISEMSYKKIRHPEDILKKGEKVSVSVIKVDRENKKVSLSLKNTLPSPWEGIDKKLNVGSVVSGRVSRIMSEWAFVTIEDVEGFLPKREMDKEALEEGQEVKVKIIELNPKKERMTLSLRDIKKEEDIEKFLAKTGKGGFKLGEVLQSKYDRDSRYNKHSKDTKHNKKWKQLEEWE